VGVAMAKPFILVVDDNPSVRKMIKTFLELEGYLACEASNGIDALAKIEEILPDAVLLDVMMPVMDGYTFCQKLRENEKTKGVVVIFLSVLDKVDSKVRGLHAGGDDFLSKPFDPSELMARLNSHLRRFHAQKEKEAMLERLAEKLAKMNQRLQEEAATDSLTGLYNRRYFCKRMEEELQRCRRFRHPLAFLFLDLDGFKAINDSHGHPFGDLVLREFAKFLQTHVRGIDLVCQWGGEEFALLLPETSLEQAQKVASRLNEACQAFSLPPLPQGTPTFSAGVASFPEHGDTAQMLYEKADKALYEAKLRGKNRVVLAL
jgi:two-component system cell cycle response regulator